MNRKVTKLSAPAKERLALIEYVELGHSVEKAAQRWKIDVSTAYNWIKMYQAEGVKGLSVPRKPRAEYNLDPDEVSAILQGAPQPYQARLQRLLELAEGKPLKQVAEDWTISVQSIMKDRRLFVAGKLPPIVQL